MNLRGNWRDMWDVEDIIITDTIEDIIILEVLLNFRVNTALTVSVEQKKDLI